ncbi:DsbA family protein [Canibacter zhoujuaniae]|uniref:DsbA family protein n=1 Tax=Canibacter zhoujuaniae TaxID=2708343 RepID=UPI001421435C|nr:thioredoxin domain-containing protein [Canibacter zhoujuaniae]
MNQNLSKQERRNLAREQARLAREQEAKKAKRNRITIQALVALVVVGVLVLAGLAIAQQVRPEGPAVSAANMQSGGVVFGKDLQVEKTPALAADESFVPTAINTAERPVHVQLYLDFICPACGAFEQRYGELLEKQAAAGDLTFEVTPLNFLDASSAGTRYSTRAANLFSCVVDKQPEHAFKVQRALFEKQPAEGTPGLKDQELLDLAVSAGTEKTAELTSCVNSRPFGSFTSRVTNQVTSEGIIGLNEGSRLVGNPTTGELQEEGKPQILVSTPTVLVNGEQWVPQRDGDLEQFLLKTIQDAKAANG